MATINEPAPINYTHSLNFIDTSPQITQIRCTCAAKRLLFKRLIYRHGIMWDRSGECWESCTNQYYLAVVEFDDVSE